MEVGDVTNYGRIETITMYGNYKIKGRPSVVGHWRDIYKINVKNEEEVKFLTDNPLTIKINI